MSRLYNILDKICDVLPTLETQLHKVNVTINQDYYGKYTEGDLTITKPGYTPLGIVGYSSGSTIVVLPQVVMRDPAVGSGRIHYVARSLQGSPSVQLQFNVLWIKLGGVLKSRIFNVLGYLFNREEVAA